MISHKYKCIFVHIPKCGGTSIENMLWAESGDRCEANLWMGYVDRYRNKYQTGGLQHLFASQIKTEVGQKVFDEYYKFTLVRNPWDKAVSQYCYIKQRKDLREYIGMKAKHSFNEYLSLIQRYEHVQWEPQWKFILDGDGRPLLSHVGRFEKYNDEVNKILNKLGVAVDEIPHAKKSERRDYRDYYDVTSIEMVGCMYQRDIELFGYSFE